MKSMKAKAGETWKRGLAVSAICFTLGSQIVWAQSLGPQPQFNVAVQGQTGAQPEGAFLNFINWIGNVIAPVGAGDDSGSLHLSGEVLETRVSPRHALFDPLEPV